MEIEYGKCNNIFLDLLKNILVKDVKKRYTLKQIELFLVFVGLIPLGDEYSSIFLVITDFNH